MTLYEIDSAIIGCMDEETGEIIEGAMEELELDNIQKAENIALSIKNDTAMAKALKEEIDKLTQRLRTCNNGIDSKKKYLPYLLGDKKLKTARVSVSYRNSESVTIDDLGSLTEEYIRIPEPQADKTAIKKAIKAGKEVAGAHIETSKERDREVRKMGDVYTKLQKIQAELKVPKSKYSDYGGYSYRSLEDIYEAVKPLLDREGLILAVNDEVIMLGNRFYIKATAILKDIESEGSFCTTAYAREEESKKKMDAAQVTGSASSYARKYALNSLFLLDDSKDADTDEYKRNEVITEKEAKRLYDLMQKKGMTEAQIKEWASQRGLKSLYQTTQQQYAEAMKEL